MKKPKPELVRPPQETIDRVQAIAGACRDAIHESLPEEDRKARTDYNRWRRETARERWKAKAESHSERRRRIFERLCSGHTHAEISQALRIHPSVVTRTVSEFFPFTPPGKHSRYVTARISATIIESLDQLAKDMLLSRIGSIEAILQANLENDAFRARQTLRMEKK
jgi:hypothetical protein